MAVDPGVFVLTTRAGLSRKIGSITTNGCFAMRDFFWRGRVAVPLPLPGNPREKRSAFHQCYCRRSRRCGWEINPFTHEPREPDSHRFRDRDRAQGASRTCPASPPNSSKSVYPASDRSGKPARWVGFFMERGNSGRAGRFSHVSTGGRYLFPVSPRNPSSVARREQVPGSAHLLERGDPFLNKGAARGGWGIRS